MNIDRAVGQRLASGPWPGRASLVAALLVAGLFIAQLVVIMATSVNVLAVDDWDSLGSGGLDQHLNWLWVFSRFNEHLIVPTKVFAWLMLKWTHWNLNVHLLLNYGLYAAASYAWARLARIAFGVPIWIAILPFASNIAYEDLSVSMQTCFNFALLFHAAAVNSSFAVKRPGYGGLVFVTLTCLSLGCGIGFAAAFGATHLLVAATCQERRTHSLIHGAWSLAIAAIVAFGTPTGSRLWPWAAVFWSRLANSVAYGLGYESGSPLIGFALIFVFALAMLYACGGETIWSKKHSGVGSDAVLAKEGRWICLSLVGAVFGATSLILMARAYAGPIGHISRYAHIAMNAAPLILGACWFAARRLLRRQSQMRQLCAAGLSALILIAPYADRFDHLPYYEPGYWARVEGLHCVEKYYRSGGTAVCPTIYPGDLTRHLQRARELNLSFYREAMRGM